MGDNKEKSEKLLKHEYNYTRSLFYTALGLAITSAFFLLSDQTQKPIVISSVIFFNVGMLLLTTFLGLSTRQFHLEIRKMYSKKLKKKENFIKYLTESLTQKNFNKATAFVMGLFIAFVVSLAPNIIEGFKYIYINGTFLDLDFLDIISETLLIGFFLFCSILPWVVNMYLSWSKK